MPAIPAIIAVASTAATVVSQKDAARKAQHAVQDQQKLANGLNYEPIDLDKLSQTAHDQAVKNATDSLALEQSLQPDVARSRSELSKSVADQLALGGQLPADTINQVTRAARVASGGSGGLGGSSVPLTAGLLGISSLNLLNQRQAAASGLLAANPLPSAGLDPGSIASIEAQQNAAQNQFNLAKAGIQSNLINSSAQAGVAQTSANLSGFNSLLSLLTNGAAGGAGGGIAAKLGAAYGKNPATNPQTGGSGYIGPDDL